MKNASAAAPTARAGWRVRGEGTCANSSWVDTVMNSPNWAKSLPYRLALTRSFRYLQRLAVACVQAAGHRFVDAAVDAAFDAGHDVAAGLYGQGADAR